MRKLAEAVCTTTLELEEDVEPLALMRCVAESKRRTALRMPKALATKRRPHPPHTP